MAFEAARQSLTAAQKATVRTGLEVNHNIGSYTLTALLALSTTDFTAGVTTALVSSPETARGLWMWSGTILGWRLVQRSGIFGQLDAWFDLPFQARAAIACAGGTPFWTPHSDAWDSSAQAATHTGLSNAFTNITNNDPYRRVIRLVGDTTLTADLTVPAGVTLISPTGRTLSGAYNLILSDDSCVVGVNFASGAGIRFASSTGQRNLQVIACRFDTISSAIQDNSTADNSNHIDGLVVLNEFKNCTYGTYYQRVERFRTAFNRYRYTSGSGRGFWFIGGKSNLTEYNDIDGCIVAIGALLDRTITRQYVRNVVRYNVVKNVSEEALAIDLYGNDVDKMSVIDRLVVASTTGSYTSNPSLVLTRTGGSTSGISADTDAVVVLTGSAKGKMFVINYVTNHSGTEIRVQFNNYTVPDADLSNAVGAYVAIVRLCADNIIHGNWVEAAVTPISLWGVGHNTVITENIVEATVDTNPAIKVTQLAGFSPSSGTNTNCVAPVTETVVVGNIIRQGKLWLSGHTYTTEGNTTPYAEPMPSFVGANSRAVDEKRWWINGDTWGTVEDAGAETAVSGTLTNGLHAAPFLDLVVPGYEDLRRSRREATGVSTQSGNGSATTFSVWHGLDGTPSFYQVVPASTDAKGDFWVTVTSGQLTVNYGTAPANGTNNVKFTWLART